MRVLVCGGRRFGEMPGQAQFLFAELDKIHSQTPIDLIIQGGALGADNLAVMWSLTRRVEFKTYEAEWETYGKGAGHIRNRDMLLDGKPDLVVAFPGGAGTANMISQTKLRDFKLVEPQFMHGDFT